MWIKIQNNILAPGVTWGRLLNMTTYMFGLVHPGYLTKVSASWIGWMLHRERVAPQWLLWKQGQEV